MILDPRFLILVNNLAQEDTESNLHKFGIKHITNQDLGSRIQYPESQFLKMTLKSFRRPDAIPRSANLVILDLV